MKAVILAAGEGSRMRPLTDTRPKVMLPIANRPILEHLLLEAIGAGIADFILVVGYREEQVRDYFGNGERWGVRIGYASQRRQQGTADAIASAASTINENFLVLNGDVIARREDIADLAARAETTMNLIEVTNTSGLGTVETAGDRVAQIHEKRENPPTRLANTGIYLFTPAIFRAIAATPPSPRGELEITDSLQLLVDQGENVAWRTMGYWLDLSYPWDLLGANEAFLDMMAQKQQGTIEANVVTEGPVSIGEGTRIRSGSYITGPVIIGNNCDIGPNCYIRPHTSIGDNCHVGAAVEVKNSIILRGAKLPHHNYVGDSVIGENCNFGAGTKVANLRLDKQSISVGGTATGRRKLGTITGDGVETGINASLNVGSLIGSGAFIGMGAVASGTILPGARIY